MDVLRPAAERPPDVLLVAVGAMAPVCLQTADLLAGPGHRLHRRRPALGQARRPGAARASPPSTGSSPSSRTTAGPAGVGAAVAQALRDAEVDVPLRTSASREQFLAHAKRGEVLADIGLTPVEIAGRISAGLADQGRAGQGRVRAVGAADRPAEEESSKEKQE